MEKDCMKHYSLVALLLVSAPAFATSCEESFQKKGNPLTGTTYMASVSVPNLSVDSAMGQLRGVAIKNKLDILAEDAGGTMLAEEPETITHKPIPITFTASEGQVDMTVKLGRGAFGAGADAMKKYLCDMLGEIKPGKEGAAIAANARRAGAGGNEIKMEAGILSNQIKRQAADNQAAIGARYKGKTFRISGRLNSAGVMEFDGEYRAGFQTLDDSLSNVAITCRMAADQTAYALSLRGNERVTLVGTFDQFDQMADIFWVKDCRRAK
jgi:hypothetical protein